MKTVKFHSSPSQEGEQLKTEEIGLKLKVMIRQHMRDIDKLYDISAKATAYFQAVSNDRENFEITSSVYAGYKSAQACWFFGMAATKPSDLATMGFSSMDEFYKACFLLMDEEKWPGFKCTTVAGLRKRLLFFSKALRGKITFIAAYESMVSKKTGNRNALKLGLEQQAFLVTTYSSIVGYKMLFGLYKARAARMIELGFWNEENSTISFGGMRIFLNKPEIKKLWLGRTTGGHVKKLSISNLKLSGMQ